MRWTQPSGPLCLWQFFCTHSFFLLDRFSPLVCILVRECLYLSLALHRYYYKKVSTQKEKWSQNHLILTEVKINGANEDMIVAACEQFGDKSDEEVTKKETCKSQKNASLFRWQIFAWKQWRATKGRLWETWPWRRSIVTGKLSPPKSLRQDLICFR